jgi:hypothetical protein
MKKPEAKKSRDTVPLNDIYPWISLERKVKSLETAATTQTADKKVDKIFLAALQVL